MALRNRGTATPRMDRRRSDMKHRIVRIFSLQVIVHIAVISFMQFVVREEHCATRALARIDFGVVRNKGRKEDEISRAGLEQDPGKSLAVLCLQRSVELSSNGKWYDGASFTQPLLIDAWISFQGFGPHVGYLKASVFQGGGVNGYHGGDMLSGSQKIIRRKVLVWLEGTTPGPLEVNFLLEQNMRLFQQL